MAIRLSLRASAISMLTFANRATYSLRKAENGILAEAHRQKEKSARMKALMRIATCAAVLLAGSTLRAQDTTNPLASSSSVPEEHEQTLRWIWVGASANMSPLHLFSGKTYTDSNDNTTSSVIANSEAGGGLNISLHLLHNYWLNLGATYYYGGYDTTTSLNDAVSTLYVERTRARIFDFPVLVRYTGHRFLWSRYAFYEVGGTLRYLSSINEHETAVNTSGYYCCAVPTTTQFKRETEGITVGTGIVFKDDFGIKSAPEVRYTRYMDNAIAGPTVGTMRNQLEIALTFGK